MKLKFNINSNVVKSKNNLEIARKYHHYDNVESIHVTANEDVYHIDAVVSVFNIPKCSLDIKIIKLFLMNVHAHLMTKIPCVVI